MSSVIQRLFQAARLQACVAFRDGCSAGLRSPQKRTALLATVSGIQDARPPDPWEAIRSELTCVRARMRNGLTSEIPAMQQAAMYFFQEGAEGKSVRPSVCLLLGSALSVSAPPPQLVRNADLRPVAIAPTEPRRRQQRIAEIAELIHVASLMHDDVIDEAETRRGRPALNVSLGNKVAILAGDFLLARASMTLASLQNAEVIALMSQILEDLVNGEVLQATAARHKLATMEHYLQKTYLKTASLLANACKATALLCDADRLVCDAAFDFGRHFGLAFQVTDDILDFTGKSSLLGKPALNDIKSGVVTCPVLFAAEEFPELVPMITRKFREPADVETAIRLVERSRGIERSRQLAQEYIDNAITCLGRFGKTPSVHADVARHALQEMCRKLQKRSR